MSHEIGAQLRTLSLNFITHKMLQTKHQMLQKLSKILHEIETIYIRVHINTARVSVTINQAVTSHYNTCGVSTPCVFHALLRFLYSQRAVLISDAPG